MMEKWDGRERRETVEDREGRRRGDQRCPDHHLLWRQHDEEKANFKTDSEKAQGLTCKKIAALEAYHIRDLNEVKADMDKKADKDDLKPIVASVRNLIVIGCLVVSGIMTGALAWMKIDQSDMKNDISAIAPSIQRVNQRISETVSERVAVDLEQTRKLESIDGKLGTVSWRLSQLEDSHKTANKFVPDKPNGKAN
jgi:hypothetical protein